MEGFDEQRQSNDRLVPPAYWGPANGIEVLGQKVADLKEFYLVPGESELTLEQEQDLAMAIAGGRSAELGLKDPGNSNEDVGCLLKIIEDAEVAKRRLAENYLSLVIAMAYASVGAVEQGLEHDARINLIRKGSRRFKAISKFAFEHAVLDDRIQEGTIGLWRAVQEATPGRKDGKGELMSFAIFAAHAIYDNIAAYCKTGEKTIEAPIPEIPRSAEDPVDAAIQVTGSELIRDVLKKLGQGKYENAQYYAQVITLQFGLDGNGEKSFDQIATLLGMRRERVRELSVRALARLRSGSYRQTLIDALPVVPWRTDGAYPSFGS